MSVYTDLVGCRFPLQQAPMGAVSSPELAVAVAEAGGVGTITALGVPAVQLDSMLAKMASSTSGTLSVNFLTAGWDRDAVAAAARRVRLIDFFWVDPDQEAVEIAHRGGALVCWQVGSVGEARAAVDAGCDVITVQGTEAGGHVRGDRPLLPLLEEVLSVVSVPVLAAGGIGDARSVRGLLEAGAAGVRIGTRFIATVESGAHPRTSKQSSTPLLPLLRSPMPSPYVRCARPARGRGSCAAASKRSTLSPATSPVRPCWPASVCPCPRVPVCHPEQVPPETSRQWPCTPATPSSQCDRSNPPRMSSGNSSSTVERRYDQKGIPACAGHTGAAFGRPLSSGMMTS